MVQLAQANWPLGPGARHYATNYEVLCARTMDDWFAFLTSGQDIELVIKASGPDTLSGKLVVHPTPGDPHTQTIEEHGWGTLDTLLETLLGIWRGAQEHTERA